MNSNSKLKIVWMVCGVAIVLLFCTQAYWLHLQCQYSLDQQIEDVKNGRIVKDDIETGHGIIIPLWYFGMNY